MMDRTPIGYIEPTRKKTYGTPTEPVIEPSRNRKMRGLGDALRQSGVLVQEFKLPQ